MIFTNTFIQLFFIFIILFFLSSLPKNKLGSSVLIGLNLLVLVEVMLSGTSELTIIEFITFSILFSSIGIYSAFGVYKNEY